MKVEPIISVIIVYWNSAEYLPRCLENLNLQAFRNFEVVLIDNGSTDNGIKDIEQRYPNLPLRIKKLDQNLGFAAANNVGARLARGQWLALLNTDTYPEPDWLEKLILASECHPEYSCFSSRQIQVNASDLLDGCGDAYHVSGMAWRRYLGYPANQYGLEQEEIYSPCAAAALYSRDAFLEAGGFDEDFFSYYEDVDLGFRLRLCGYRCLYVPDAIVHHVGSGTFGVKSDFAFYHSHRNLVWTFVQNMPLALFWKYLPAHIMANVIYVAYYTLLGRGKVLWKAKWDALRGLPNALKKRQKIQSNRRVSNADLLSTMERGWLQPYLLGYHLRRALASSQKDK
jgi:GT2 family glycosyltransferase